MNLAQILVKGSVLVFVVSSMLAIGLSASIDRIVAPLARPVWVLRALVANFVLAPALVVAMTRLLPLEPGYELGLMLLAFAAGSPLLPKLAEAGRTDPASAASLMVLLMAVSVAVMPVALPMLVPGMQVDPWRIAAPLILLMLAPLALGMLWRRLAPQLGARFLPAITKLSNIGFVAVVLLICGTNLEAMLGVLGSGAIASAIGFIVLLYALAWAVAEPQPAGRRLLGYASAARNTGAALVTAGASGADPKAAVMLIVTGVIGLLLLLAAAAWARRRGAAD
jgi:bile acid:Na+ symporter, BASS family